MLSDAQIQAALNKAGYGPLTVDGIIGTKTRAAIKRFQALNKLMPDGIVGPKTDKALSRFYETIQPRPITPPVETEDANVMSPKGIAMLYRSEGKKLAAYRDTKGVITIGVGATWGSEVFQDWWNKHRPGKAFDMSATMTEAEVLEVTAAMIRDEYGKAVNDALGGKKVPQHVFDAAVHATYNMGIGGLKWRWFQAVRAGNYVQAANLLRTGYNKPPELFGRRQKEGDLMEHAVYH